jgi:hypothetical protein
MANIFLEKCLTPQALHHATNIYDSHELDDITLRSTPVEDYSDVLNIHILPAYTWLHYKLIYDLIFILHTGFIT